MKRTADTITDTEIRELQSSPSPVTGNIGWACSVALGESGGTPSPEYVRECRQVCADAWNARHGGES